MKKINVTFFGKQIQVNPELIRIDMDNFDKTKGVEAAQRFTDIVLNDYPELYTEFRNSGTLDQTSDKILDFILDVQDVIKEASKIELTIEGEPIRIDPNTIRLNLVTCTPEQGVETCKKFADMLANDYPEIGKKIFAMENAGSDAIMDFVIAAQDEIKRIEENAAKVNITFFGKPMRINPELVRINMDSFDQNEGIKATQRFVDILSNDYPELYAEFMNSGTTDETSDKLLDFILDVQNEL